jgi:hypothetical protein
MTKWRTAVLVAALLTGCSRPHQAPGPVPVPAPTPAPTPSRPPIGEQLLAKPPSGWTESYATKSPGMRMAQYIPSGDDSHDWTNMVSFESFTGNPLPQPPELLASVAKDQQAVCDNFESHTTYTGNENGYPTTVALFVCDRSKLTQKGQLTLLKMIRGDDNFYVITRSRRSNSAGRRMADTKRSHCGMVAVSAWHRRLQRRQYHPPMSHRTSGGGQVRFEGNGRQAGHVRPLDATRVSVLQAPRAPTTKRP